MRERVRVGERQSKVGQESERELAREGESGRERVRVGE